MSAALYMGVVFGCVVLVGLIVALIIELYEWHSLRVSLKAVYTDLASRQEPLGDEFMAALEDRDSLYET